MSRMCLIRKEDPGFLFNAAPRHMTTGLFCVLNGGFLVGQEQIVTKSLDVDVTTLLTRTVDVVYFCHHSPGTPGASDSMAS